VIGAAAIDVIEVMPEIRLNFISAMQRRAAPGGMALHGGPRNTPQEAIITLAQRTRPHFRIRRTRRTNNFPCFAAAPPRLSNRPPASHRYDGTLEAAPIRRYPHKW
jgi:hypothetical protein